MNLCQKLTLIDEFKVEQLELSNGINILQVCAKQVCQFTAICGEIVKKKIIDIIKRPSFLVLLIGDRPSNGMKHNIIFINWLSGVVIVFISFFLQKSQFLVKSLVFWFKILVFNVRNFVFFCQNWRVRSKFWFLVQNLPKFKS